MRGIEMFDHLLHNEREYAHVRRPRKASQRKPLVLAELEATEPGNCHADQGLLEVFQQHVVCPSEQPNQIFVGKRSDVPRVHVLADNLQLALRQLHS